MLSAEAKLNEVLEKLNATQKAEFSRIVEARGLKGKAEPQIHVAESIKNRVTKHNGRFTESITESAWTPIQERQVAAYVAGGMSQLEAEVAAGVHDQAIREGAMTGKSVAQVVESLR